jgi:hypothetical protein
MHDLARFLICSFSCLISCFEGKSLENAGMQHEPVPTTGNWGFQNIIELLFSRGLFVSG